MTAIDFSLVNGGPLYQIWRRLPPAGRIGVLLLLVWAPLLLLSLAEGNVWNDSLNLPFTYDIETHLRLLVALPILVLAETIVHQRLRLIVGQFGARQLISEKAQPQFDAAVASAMHLRNSVSAELILLAFVYVVGLLFIRPAPDELDVASWRGFVVDGQMQWSLAGWWLRVVSLPLFQFLVLRWYLRLFIWARFLWQVSRLKLNIEPTHSDHCGGLGFLTEGSLAFAPVLLAQGTLLSAMMANRIFYAGAKLSDFKLEFFGLVTFMVLAMLAPLLVFSPKLARVKRAGLLEYGMLAQRYVLEFDRKWLRGGAPGEEPLVGSADVQSLADLSNAFSVIERMRLVPFNIQAMLQLAALTLLPVLPLALTTLPLRELSERLINLVF